MFQFVLIFDQSLIVEAMFIFSLRIENDCRITFEELLMANVFGTLPSLKTVIVSDENIAYSNVILISPNNSAERVEYDWIEARRCF